MSETAKIAEPVQQLAYPIEEAAAMIGMPTRSFRKLVYRGALPVVTFPGGRRQYIRREDLQALVERCAHTEGRR